jgi:uncharacterized protein YdeI (YjbR/CyaY-like superfamily)
MDDEKFAQKFTPRRDNTKWSALNKRRLRKLIREGRMTEAGLAKVELATLGEETQSKQSKSDQDIPRFIKQALMTNGKETRERRLREAVSLLEQNKKLGLK